MIVNNVPGDRDERLIGEEGSMEIRIKYCGE